MRTTDLVQFCFAALRRQRFRTIMLLIAVAIGVSAVIILTGLGEGARLYVVKEFAGLGSDLLIMLPGKKETTGGLPPLTGKSPRDVTVDDAMSLLRLRTINDVAPLVIGNAEISYQERSREVITLGTTTAYFRIRNLLLEQGDPLPIVEPDRAPSVCVLGAKIKQELFGSANALGEWVRAGDRRYRVIGVLASRGESMGFDLSDIMIIPVASAQKLFNTPGLFRVIIEPKNNVELQALKTNIIDLMRERHDGEEDVTIISQDSVLAAFNQILLVLTLAVASIGGISLLVAGVLIMNITLINVSQRTQEIGLLKALGANNHEIRTIFLFESMQVAILGSLIGVVLGIATLWLARSFYPSIPFSAPMWAPPLAIVVATVIGVIFALLPARRAARLEPINALMNK